MAPRETENNAYAKFGVTNKEHYGMLWYFLEWSIINHFLKRDNNDDDDDDDNNDSDDDRLD